MNLYKGARMSKLRTAAGAACCIALLVSTGCGTKGSDDSGREVDGVKLGPGVTEDTINLGMITDLSGPLAAQGSPALAGLQAYVDQLNASGGVCDRFEVKLDVQDSGYDVQKAVRMYDSMSEDVAALILTMGAPINAALRSKLEDDEMLNLPSAWGRSLTSWEGNVIVGTTVDVEMVNGLDFILENGLVSKGDKIGHVYFEGEFGENGLEGSEHFAEEQGLEIVGAQIATTDADMTAQVTRFKAAGVSAIALSVGPNQTASVASVAKAVGLEVPIVANYPGFVPGLLDSPVASFLKDHLYVSASFAPWFLDAKDPVAEAWKKSEPDGTPTSGISGGAAFGEVMQQILEAACESGDMTRAGLLKARSTLTKVDTGGQVVPLDLSRSGDSPALVNYIQRPADEPGGLKIVDDGYQGPSVNGL